MIKRIMAAFAALAAIVATLIAGGSPAFAAGPCNPQGICFYDTSTSATAMLDLDATDVGHLECINLPAGAQAKTSYVNNRSSWQFHPYLEVNCGGAYGHLWANTAGSLAYPWNNSIRSVMRVD